MTWKNGICGVIVACLLAAAALMPLSASHADMLDLTASAAMAADVQHEHGGHGVMDPGGDDCASQCSSTCGQCSHCQAAPADRMTVDRSLGNDGSEPPLERQPARVTHPFRPPISA
ncbi:hypothetical protein M0534_13260 [Methylonatrum kenyense]|uniref:hypothetical protein n=1 Tax=Methylonatrum kenyense TaxID=455253 RepID=UPI0020C11C7E|nr:hypothetical protein [Methylonatrum kenyense]MCK8517283.1 hypothetical protein [Methylonatrum kenyense]